MCFVGLWTREEKEIAIVSRSGFLYHSLNMYGGECHPTVGFSTRGNAKYPFLPCGRTGATGSGKRLTFPDPPSPEPVDVVVQTPCAVVERATKVRLG